MQVSIESINALGRRLHIEVPGHEIEEKVNYHLNELAKKTKLPGFRTGKIPFHFIKQKYESIVRDDVAHELMQKKFAQAVSEKKIHFIGTPLFSSHDCNHPVEKGESLNFFVEYELFPEITLKPLHELSLERPVCTITEHDVDQRIQIIQKHHAKWHPVDRPSQLEDRLLVDLERRVKDKLVSGSQIKNFNLDINALRDSTAINSIEPILNRSPGETTVLQFKTEEASLHITIHQILEPRLPDLNELNLKNWGILDGQIETLRKEVRHSLENEVSQRLKEKIRKNITESLCEAHDLNLPPRALAQEIRNLQTLRYQALKEKIDFETFLKETQPSFQAIAEKQMKIGLLFSTIIQLNGIQPDKNKIQQRIKEQASAHPRSQTAKLSPDQTKLLYQEVENGVLEEQVIDLLLEKMKITDKSLSYQDLIRI